ncbi:MAG: enoyl-ACP reductase, partial [Kineosporiaceae bacterium]
VRLEAVRRGLGERAATWPLLTVDATDERAVSELAARTRVLVTTVGPYSRYGLPLVTACAAAGTHYADLTGEVLFVRRSIDANHRTAQRTRARIVHSCGFDAVPSDLGVWLTAQAAAADGAGTLTETTLHVTQFRGGVSGGTIDSARQQAIEASGDPAVRPLLADPYALSPSRAEEPAEPPAGRVARLRGVLPIGRTAPSGVFTAPFVMASFNTRIVRRSNALAGWSYGRGLRYREVMDAGTGPRGALTAIVTTVGLGALAGGLMLGPTRAVLDRLLPAPGQGPSERTLRAGRFAVEIEAMTTSGARYLTRFGAGLDPGYYGTAVMLGESALALALDDLPDRAGVLTPAIALGDALALRLRVHGFTVETCRIPQGRRDIGGVHPDRVDPAS